MANPEHVAILDQGVEVWNQWQKEHSYLQLDLSRIDLFIDEHFEFGLYGPNLSGAIFSRVNLFRAVLIRTTFIKAKFSGVNLSESDLREANLSEATFTKTNLSLANLRGAKFCGSTLFEVNLTGVDLTGADLTGTSFIGTDFTEANLYKANLAGANFKGSNFSKTNLTQANLTGADLSNAIMHLTILGDINLSKVKGLKTISHRGPSIIGIDTIIKSRGHIPEVFLRRAGVPPSIIEQIPALISTLKPTDYYSCFISYSSNDQEFADRLYADLQSKGVRCWFAPHDMHIGDKIRPRIDESIRLYDKVLLVLTEHSVASQWVEHEVETALGKELEGKPNVLFPIRLDEAVMQSKTGWASHIRLTRHIGDFTNWKNHDEYQKAFNRLLRDLKAEAETTEV